MTELTGHTSPDTAYLVEDYPYGYVLRCQIRYWIETKKGQGQRVVSQTLNPKTNRWNAPKPSTYTSIKALYLDENNHVQNGGLSPYDDEAKIEAFLTQFPKTCADERNQSVLEYLRRYWRAQKKATGAKLTTEVNS